MCIPVQKYKSQYKKKVSEQKKIFYKIWKKSVGTLYMIITYLNKPYILHYCKLSRLYGTKHNHTPLYNPMYHHQRPCTPTPHQIPLNIHPFITPCTSILHHIPLYITIHPCTSPSIHV